MVEEERGRWALDRSTISLKEYMAAGPGEEVDASKYDWNANSTGGGSLWVPAATPMRDSIFPGVNKAHSAETTGDNFWGLIPDPLPPMEYARTSPGEAVRADSAELRDFPAKPVTVPPSGHVHLLLDRKTLTTGVSTAHGVRGQGARIRLTYSEALYDKNKHKGDRDAVGDRVALGLNDSFLPDGGPHRYFEPLWWRTWRYLDLDITPAPSRST